MSEEPKVTSEDSSAEPLPTEEGSSDAPSNVTPETEPAKAEKKPRARRARKAAAPKAEAAEAAAPKAEAVAETADSGEKPAVAPKPAAVAPTGRRPVVRAHAKYVRTSARKARLVCDHIRGKSVAEAEAILAFAPRAVASDWAKLLKSAVANAENNHELLADDLRIK
jgi:hypothetical protein